MRLDGSNTGLLALLSLAAIPQSVLSTPHSLHPLTHLHAKRVDYTNPALYKDVDWSKVNYGSPAPAPAPAAAKAPAPAAPKAPAPAPAPKQEQKATAPQTESKATTGGASASSGSKRGLSYNYDSPSLAPFAPYSGAGHPLSWIWNWAASPFHTPPSSLAYVPTLHSLKPEILNTWSTDIQSALTQSHAKEILGFNEPDIADQANLAPGLAASKFRDLILPHKNNGIRLGSPQVSNGVGTNPATGQPYGLDWLKSFFSACGKDDCGVDFLAVHWYGCTDGCPVSQDVAAFKAFVKQAEEFAAGKKVWITEFATKNADQSGFMDAVLPWLDGEAGVDRYAYFMAAEGSLMQGGGLSAAGKTYVA